MHDFILFWNKFSFDDQMFKNDNFQDMLTLCKDFRVMSRLSLKHSNQIYAPKDQ